MHVLLGIAFKSVLIAGLTLVLLQLFRRRSAAERSWVAHIGLIALVLLAFAPLVLPDWTVEAPALFGSAPAANAPQMPPMPPAATAVPTTAVPTAQTVPTSRFKLSPSATTMALYAVPAAILLLITFIALARLIALRARAEVLVDGHWLSALARAQRRMGFKHGTALLTSNELASPISWGLMRPVILLNSRAVEASGEAEAIIAHELAHVARMDWVKLLLARVATALFWFNPLVWMLAREAHQLREETADDAVLAADISDTDYAQLLVGVARHECPGLLLGAHGVAPSKSSLSRRVARVLDGKSVRGPAARGFAAGVFAGAVIIAAPLAALTLAPAGTRDGTVSAAESLGHFSAPTSPSSTPTDLPHIIAKGVSTSVASAVAAIGQVPAGDFRIAAPNGATVMHLNGMTVTNDAGGAVVTKQNGTTVATAPSGANVTIYPADRSGRRKVVAVSSSGATSVIYTDPDVAPSTVIGNWTGHSPGKSAVARAIEMKAAGVTPEYIGAMRAAAPQLARLETDEFASLHAVGVTPEYARGMIAAFPSISPDDLVTARAVGMTGAYVQAMRSAGVRGDIDDLVQLYTVGVEPSFVARARRSGIDVSDVNELIQLRALGNPPPVPPRPPAAPRPPGG